MWLLNMPKTFPSFCTCIRCCCWCCCKGGAPLMLLLVSSRVGQSWQLWGSMVKFDHTVHETSTDVVGFGNKEWKERCFNCCRHDSIVIVLYKYILVGFGINWQQNRKGKKARMWFLLCYDTATLCVAMCLWCQPWPVFFICPPGRAESRWFPIDSTHGDRWICNRHFKPTHMNFSFKFTSRLW